MFKGLGYESGNEQLNIIVFELEQAGYMGFQVSVLFLWMEK